MDCFEKSYSLLKSWKQDSYIFGINILDSIAKEVSKIGKRVLLIASKRSILNELEVLKDSFKKSGIEILAIAPAVRPNAPKEDVYKLSTYILQTNPDCVVAFSGGSTIDAAKAAISITALATAYSFSIDDYFGTNKITNALSESKRELIPLVAIESSSSSASHLTKYSNITDMISGQKKLIVDQAIVPKLSIFDYSVTKSMPRNVTIDGALDALSHTFEVFCGAKEDNYELLKEITLSAFELVFSYAKRAVDNPEDLKAREALGLATDLGGYAIMIGGTSGAHLTSFSLVDVLNHGSACGLMNPYYAVLYSRAIQKQLKDILSLLIKHNYVSKECEVLTGRSLSEAVANGLISFSKSIGSPTSLNELANFKEDVHIKRALIAAKDPDLKMKLQNMPISMSFEDVDTYMMSVLLAAAVGDLTLVKEM